MPRSGGPIPSGTTFTMNLTTTSLILNRTAISRCILPWLGREGRAVEVQIRTFDMHQNAELGVAAHWRYKEGDLPLQDAAAQQIAWLRQMLEYREEDSDDGDLLERFKAEAFQIGFTRLLPKARLLSCHSTPLDFAYHVHTEVGHRCRGAKVTGRIVPLTCELKTGEQVDVLTAKSGGPSRDWLSPHLGYIKSHRGAGCTRSMVHPAGSGQEHRRRSGRSGTGISAAGGAPDWAGTGGGKA